MRLEGLIGERLGRYQIEALIGRGGMAAVYRAFDPALQRYVALKVLYPQFLADPDLVERFRREAVTAAALDHPNIAQIYDVGDADGLVYLAMKLLPGPSLAELLQREGHLPLSRTVALTWEIAAALEEAHGHGIVHRDIKPGNVLFDSRNRAILTDFGIAKSLDTSSMTGSSVIIGTPDYIAPEQIDSSLAAGGQVDSRADIYALGAMLYRTLTGQRPFEGAGQAVLLAHLRDEPQPASTVMASLPGMVDLVIARAMAKRPDDRYATAVELAQDLEAAQSDATPVGSVFPAAGLRRDAHTRPTTEATSPAAAPLGSRPRRFRTIVTLATFVLLVALGSGLYRWVSSTADRLEAAGSPGNTAITAPPATEAAVSRPTASVSPTTKPTSAATLTTAPTDTTATAGSIEMASSPLNGEIFMSAPTMASAPIGGSSAPLPSPTWWRAEPTTAFTAEPRQPTPTTAAVLPPTETSAPPTGTPEPAPAETIEPPPTETPEPPTATTAASPPTETPQPAGCAAPVQGGFGALWNSNMSLQSQLGCPLSMETRGFAVEQVFEGGTMYWWGDSGQIFVLSGGNSGRWSQYPDTWLEGEELSPLSPPAGMFSAERGFGKVWRSFPGVGDALGWAQQPEAQITGLYQRFEGGTMLYAPAINGHIDQIYVLFGDGAFAIHPDPAS